MLKADLAARRDGSLSSRGVQARPALPRKCNLRGYKRRLVFTSQRPFAVYQTQHSRRQRGGGAGSLGEENSATRRGGERGGACDEATEDCPALRFAGSQPRIAGSERRDGGMPGTEMRGVAAEDCSEREARRLRFTNIQRYTDTEIHGSRDTRIQGYTDTDIYGYRDTEMKE